MPKVQVKKQSVSLDMTAMCDVAFLLLTFFMLTAKFRPQEAAPVVTPSSVSDTMLPESDIITITVSKDNQVFLGTDAQPVRDAMLDNIAGKYGIQFTQDEKQAFRTTDQFGVPIANLKQLLAMPTAERNKPGLQKGIPCDTNRNELGDWVLAARMRNPKLKIAVKGDNITEYKTVEQVIAALQAQNINQFNLITSVERRPAKLR
jgi:biopolymer transport protein ExbD